MKVIVEADGGSRGNPGPAGYGSVVIDAQSGEVLAERGEFIGIESNNVAEYRGLIAGLEVARELGATQVAVRMDSKLVVQQMSGSWQIKHPAMRELAKQAAGLARNFESVDYQWIPRAQNARADRVANQAMDLGPGGVVSRRAGESSAPPAVQASKPAVPQWVPSAGSPTRLIIVRHGSTEHSPSRKLSGINALPLSDLGNAQARALAARLAGTPDVAAVVSSPLVRAAQTATPIAAALGVSVTTEEGYREVDFGAWEGLSFGQATAGWPQDMAKWSRNPAVAAPGGESFAQLAQRVIPARDKTLADYAGRTVIVVSHVTPIKLLLADAIGAPLESLYRIFLDTASVSVVDYPDDGLSSVRLINDTSHLSAV